MRMSTACFAHALQRCTGRACMSFLLILQEVRPIGKTRNQLGGKEGDHAYLFTQVQAAEEAGRLTTYARHDRAAGVEHRFRFINDMPLNASRADVRVNFIEYWEIGKDTIQHFSWVTNIRVSTRNIYKLMRGGRARWKIENETFNTLKNQGDNFEHNYGHGEQNWSVVFEALFYGYERHRPLVIIDTS